MDKNELFDGNDAFDIVAVFFLSADIWDLSLILC